MDCFAEPVIGRRFAPTRWLAMTGQANHHASTPSLRAQKLMARSRLRSEFTVLINAPHEAVWRFCALGRIIIIPLTSFPQTPSAFCR
jgi:hypothetical protein